MFFIFNFTGWAKGHISRVIGQYTWEKSLKTIWNKERIKVGKETWLSVKNNEIVVMVNFMGHVGGYI